MKTRITVLTIILALLIAGGFWWQSTTKVSAISDEFEATGTIETRDVNLASEISGKVAEVLVEEGEPVTAGQPLVRLDDAAITAQRAQAQATLQAAKANLALLEAGPTGDQIRAAEAQLAQAEANLQTAQADLDALTYGARPEEITALRDNLAVARSNYRIIQETLTIDQVEDLFSALNTAESNLSTARFRRDELARETYHPGFVVTAAEEAIADAETGLATAKEAYEAATDRSRPYYSQVELARYSWEVAQSNLALAEARHDRLKADERSTTDGLDAATAAHEDAQELVDAAKSAYDALTSGASAEPLDAAWEEVQRAQDDLENTVKYTFAAGSTSVETLLDQIEAAKAARDMAAANLDDIKSGSRDEEIDAARAQVEAAQAQLDQLDVQLDKTILSAPWDGVVLTRSVEPGQIALPGGTLLEIGRLDQLEMTAYVPETHFGHVTPGQLVGVRVNTYPSRVFFGTVLRLADEAEFTPTNVETKEDRARLVYEVTVSLDNPDLELKPGMIADVSFGE
jgi:multidrug resistance efflux pump